MLGCTEREVAAASNDWKYPRQYVAAAGLDIIDARLMFGLMSFRISSHLPPRECSKLVKPVTFPPGRARFETTPLPTGSDKFVNTIGIERVSRNSARAAVVLDVTMTSWSSLTSSSA